MTNAPVMTADTLDQLERAAFGYFLQAANPLNGLIADTSRDHSPASIGVVGFALSAYPAGVERAWMTREDAVERTLATLRFFRDSDQSGSPKATGYKGFYYHFLDMQSGIRVWNSELSMIDTALLIAGALTAGSYFDADTEKEIELRRIVEALYQRIDWPWTLDGKATIRMGWKPESGFLNYGWDGYSEAILLYVLALGCSTHPIDGKGFEAWTETYQWENLYGYDFLYAGPLFIHQFSHAWMIFAAFRIVSCAKSAVTTSRILGARPKCSANTRDAIRADSPVTTSPAGARLPATARAIRNRR